MSNDDARRKPLVGIDFDDAEHLQAERLGLLIAAPYAGTREREALPAGGDDDEVNVRDPDVYDCPQVRELGVPTASDTAANHPTTIVIAHVVGNHLRHGVPVTSGQVCVEADVHPARRVLEPRRRKAELVESCKRGV